MRILSGEKNPNEYFSSSEKIVEIKKIEENKKNKLIGLNNSILNDFCEEDFKELMSKISVSQKLFFDANNFISEKLENFSMQENLSEEIITNFGKLIKIFELIDLDLIKSFILSSYLENEEDEIKTYFVLINNTEKLIIELTNKLFDTNKNKNFLDNNIANNFIYLEEIGYIFNYINSKLVGDVNQIVKILQNFLNYEKSQKYIMLFNYYYNLKNILVVIKNYLKKEKVKFLPNVLIYLKITLNELIKPTNELKQKLLV